MAPYIRRPIGEALLSSSGVPVLILEGARAVGKTTLMRQQLMVDSQFTYATLADPSTRAFAENDLGTWLAGLRLPVIIDEAQLIPGLPLALKELVDELGPGRTHAILTGSASIGRSGLDGADPLARRSHRLTMHPLTSWEKQNQPGSLADALFDAELAHDYSTRTSDEELLNQMRLGGFPSYTNQILTHGQISARVRSDVISVLGDTVSPEEKFDTTLAITALDGLLRTPGGIYNASRLGQALDIDRRTADRYLSIFERLFLVHWLPNRETTASRQNHSRAKVHPVDTSFSVESLTRSGVDILQRREVFGALLESHVVNQVVASLQWSTVQAQPSYWRKADSKGAEVDLVLSDPLGRLIGIEIKASRTIGPKDISGLRALQQVTPLHRGFVIYTGRTIQRLDTHIWALPISALSDASAFLNIPALRSDERARATQGAMKVMTTTAPDDNESYDATIFLSYVHADNKRSGGKIVKIAHDLVDHYEYLYGHKLRLFVDRDDLRWGERWADRITHELDATSFLLAAVTPRYLVSTACRDEVTTFMAAAKRTDQQRLLLPLIWVDIEDSDVVAPHDPVRVALLENQFLNIPELRRLDSKSDEYETTLDEIARRLKQTIDHHVKKPSRTGDVETRPVGDDLLTIMQSLEDDQDGLEAAVLSFTTSFDDLSAVVSRHSFAQGAGASSMASDLALLGRKMAIPIAAVDAATDQLGVTWQSYEKGLSQVIRLLSDFPDASARTHVSETLESLVRALDFPGLEEFERQLTSMGNISQHMRPLSRSLTKTLALIQGIQASVRTWQGHV